MTEMEGFRAIVARHCIFVLQNVVDEEVVMDSFSRRKGTYKNYSPSIRDFISTTFGTTMLRKE